jgi:hypothetical protein
MVAFVQPSILASAAAIAAAFTFWPAERQQPLRTFSFGSSKCVQAGDLLDFGGDDFKISPATKPGAGEWPKGNFYIRKVELALVAKSPKQWAVVGHNSGNGDWITGPVLPGTARTFTYDADAAPLFTAGLNEYLDIHTGCTAGDETSAILSIGYVPAP